MKYFLFFLSLSIVGLGLWWLLRSIELKMWTDLDTAGSVPLSSPVLSLNEPLNSMSGVSVERTQYRFAWVLVEKPQQISLFSNFETKTVSSDLYHRHACRALINGGFYTEDNQPLGLFISDRKKITKAIQSTLLDGFISSSFTDGVRIGLDTPFDTVDWALQSGPLLILDSEPTELKIRNDEPSRRSVAMLTTDGKIILATITSAESVLEGPYLATLPQVTKAIAQTLDQPIQAAINLDGGSASAFKTSDLEIPEQTWIGSFFCVQ